MKKAEHKHGMEKHEKHEKHGHMHKGKAHAHKEMKKAEHKHAKHHAKKK
jgi:hypothetical protein